MKSAQISTFALIMLITGAVDSIRNLPAASLFGSSLIFFFILSAIIFFIPSALVSAELAASNTEKSGIFHWVREAFGDQFAFLAIWLQWVTNLVWFPTILSFVAGMVSYIFDPALAQNKTYLVSTILITFWFLTFINFKGLKLSTTFTSFCTLIGMALPMFLIIAMTLIWLIQGHSSQIGFTMMDIFPNVKHIDSWVSLTAIMTAFAGMELSAVHVKDVNDPQKSFPRALYISVWIILVTMILGSLSIAIVMPQGQISLVNGVMQVFSAFFAIYHAQFILPFIAVMILFGSLGGTISWVISPAKGLLQAAQIGFLPKFLSKENSHGVPTNLLILQAIVVSGVCCAFLFMPSVSGSYWLLTALSTQLYMLMYIMMFCAGLYLRYSKNNLNRSFRIPGGNAGIWTVSLLGLFGCLVTLIVGFFPPNGVNVGSFNRYEATFCTGMLIMVLPIIFFYYYRSRSIRALAVATEV